MVFPNTLWIILTIKKKAKIFKKIIGKIFGSVKGITYLCTIKLKERSLDYDF